MKQEEWFGKAIYYFNGTMTIEEAQHFENETAASEELSQLMQLWKIMDAEARLYESFQDEEEAFLKTHEKLKAEFTVEEQNKFPESVAQTNTKKTTFPAWKWMAVAAAITGIFFIAKTLLITPDNNRSLTGHTTHADSTAKMHPADSQVTSNEKDRNPMEPADTASNMRRAEMLYADAFSPDEVPENPNGPLNDAFFYYESAQYKNAITAIDSAKNKIATRGNDSFSPVTEFYAVYYKSLCMMSLGRDQEAIQLLKDAVEMNPPGNYKAKAQWYLALAYLKQGNITECENVLQLLAKNENATVYKRKAEKLIAAIHAPV